MTEITKRFVQILKCDDPVPDDFSENLNNEFIQNMFIYSKTFHATLKYIVTKRKSEEFKKVVRLP